MRSELTTRSRTETVAIRAQSAAQRREVDALSARVKESLDGLKHECVEDFLSLFWFVRCSSMDHTGSKWMSTVGKMKRRVRARGSTLRSRCVVNELARVDNINFP